MTRHALRILPGYPWPRHVGDVIPYGNTTREQLEQIRANMGTGKWHEVVELDDDGQVIEPCVVTTGWISGETYCAIHGRAAGWPCGGTRP